MNITVYLGSAQGNSDSYKGCATALGKWIGENGHTLIYGGSSVGLMGVLADGTLESGGRVIGVEPDFFVKGEAQHDGIHELIVTETMPERKNKMIELGDVYIAMPGGTGTLEEISEVISLTRLGFNSKPCIFLNIDNYYDNLMLFFDKMTEDGFLEQEVRDKIICIRDVKELDKII